METMPGVTERGVEGEAFARPEAVEGDGEVVGSDL